MLYLGSDHGGFAAKKQIKQKLTKAKISFVDLGPQEYAPDDDYPIFTKKVGLAVSKNAQHKGILICRSNTGVVIAANKVKGVRAIGATDVWTAKRGKRDENANVLCLAGEHENSKNNWSIIRAWMNQKFRNKVRDNRRLKQIKKLENGNKAA
ncbi:MAG: RpiB/LacA/LacB family sugar-phosphate isomerase [bacterium]